MIYRWRNKEITDPAVVSSLQEKLKIHHVLCNLLCQRGFTDFDSCRDFFRPSLNGLHDPFLMKDMDKAVDRIDRAVSNGEKIMVYGDYDVDGTTAVSLLSSFLLNHHTNLITYIPDRYREGYGVSRAGIDSAQQEGVSLIVALDCGIKAIDKVEYASELGIDFIICDHHRPGNRIPSAIAVLDPKREDCNYPYKELSGCGVGFKLVQALCTRWNCPEDEWKALLDLLAVSIGADIVPVTGENRILAYHGMKKINEDPRPGFALLAELTGKKGKQMSIEDVVFLIGPRINAAGRIAHGKLAVQLITGSNIEELERDSKILNEHNTERQQLDRSITDAAALMIKEMKEEERFSTVVYDEKWHKGVIGIVASRLIEKYHRPTIVFTRSNGHLAGSARSIKGFDIYNALEECSDILEQFGGHTFAAGMTLKQEAFEKFKQRFEEVVSKSIQPESLIPEIEIDSTLDLGHISPGFYKILKQFSPFGPQNMNPIFRTDNLYDSGYSKVVGSDESHLRLLVFDKNSGLRISGIGFNLADKLELIKSGKPVSVAYHLDVNEFNNKSSFQMRVKDVKLTEEVSDN